MDNYIKDCQENAIQRSLMLFQGRKDIPFSILEMIQSFTFRDVTSIRYRWCKNQNLHELRSILRLPYAEAETRIVTIKICKLSETLIEYTICRRCGNYRRLPVMYFNEMTLQMIIQLSCFCFLDETM